MITCKECSDIRAKPFSACTGAERVAVVKHLRMCKPCSDEVNRDGLEAIKQLKVSPLGLACIAAEVFVQFAKDASDPENRNVPT